MVQLPKLDPGEPIGVVALSGPVEPAKLEAGLAVLHQLGHPVELAPNLLARDATGYLAGGDDDRLAGLDWVLDRGVRLVIAARGGYGATRILDRLPWERLVQQEVSFVGFSDLTPVVNALAVRSQRLQVHGPMVAAGLEREENRERLWQVLRGELVGQTLFKLPQRSIVRHGVVRGSLIGGSLTLLSATIGTPYEPRWEGAVVLLEEVSEHLYRLDRMLTQLVASGRFRGVKALIAGSLRGCGSAASRAPRWLELLDEAAPPGAVVAAGLPFGHGATNLAFPLAVPVEVDTTAGTLTWSG